MSYKEYLLKLRDFESEFEIFASSSSGPGGQHANRRSTKIELRFNLEKTEQLNETEKKQIREKLYNRLTKDGYLIVTSQDTRSAFRNKLRAKKKFYELITEVLHQEKERKETKKPKSYHRKRLEYKKQKSEKKGRRNDDRVL